ncbi:MAG: SDR family NAD(P)-dependent oxidoreductase, partial [Traorella sp.]
MNVTYDFSGKTVLVVGAGTGMGKATSLLLANSGANVMVADFNEELGKQVVNEIKGNGGNAAFVYCDVRDKDCAFRAVKETVDTFGRIDYAANVVGITGDSQMKPFYERSDEDLKNVMDTNVTGHWWLLQAETEQMVKQGGEGYSIVEVVSIQGLVANKMGVHAYTTSKHAAMGLVKSVGIEFADKGIRIN